MTYLDDEVAKIRASLPEDQQLQEGTDLLFQIYAVLLRVKGEEVTAADVHDAWVAWSSTRYRQHPAMVPFESLPPDKQALDEPFAQAIRDAAAGHPA